MIGLMCLKELIFIKLMNHVKVLFNCVTFLTLIEKEIRKDCIKNGKLLSSRS